MELYAVGLDDCGKVGVARSVNFQFQLARRSGGNVGRRRVELWKLGSWDVEFAAYLSQR